MKSSGGLSSYQNFTGKDAVLSGPAGRVIAAVEINKNTKDFLELLELIWRNFYRCFHYKGEQKGQMIIS